MEKNEIDLWTDENLEVCIALLLANLLDAIEDKYLEHFFIQNMNLVSLKKSLENLKMRLTTF